MAQNDVLDYIRKTPYNSNVNVVKGMLNNSNNSDEDLSSDFSIATLTLIDFPDNAMIYCANAFDNAELNASWSMPYMGGINTVPVILYKGKAAILGSIKSHVKSISGNIEYNESFQLYIITGDCSMTWDYGDEEW